MGIFFYSLALLFILFELSVFINPGKVIRNLSFLLIHIGYVVWSIMGLFSSSWFLFLILLSLGLIAHLFSRVLPKMDRETYMRLDSICSIMLLISILADYYY